MKNLKDIFREYGIFSTYKTDNIIQKNVLKFCTYAISIVLILLLSILSGCQEEDVPPDGADPGDELPAETPSTPAFEILKPLRGSMLQNETENSIPIVGKACDDINPITSVFLKNSSVSLDEDGDCKTFSTEIQENWGLNIIDGFAENDLGDKVSLVHSYLRSPEFSPGLDASGFPTAVANAWTSRLTQEVLNDYNRNDLDDLTTILELAINAYNFDEAIPQVIVNTVTTTNYSCWPLADRSNRHGYKVEKSGPFNVGGVRVIDLNATPGTIEISFIIQESSFPIRVDGYFDQGTKYLGCLGDLSAGTTGTVGFKEANARGTFSVSFNDNEVTVTPNSIDINLISPYAEINPTGIDLIDGLLGDASTWVLADEIEDILEDLLSNEIQPIIKGFINEFSLQPTIDIPAPINVQLMTTSTLDNVEVHQGYIDLSLASSVRPSEYTKNDSQLERGSIIAMSTLPSFSGMNGTFGIGMKDDFTNQVLWATWAGGGFDIVNGNTATVAEFVNEVGLDASILSVETGLPPVLMHGDIGSEVKIGIGEVLIKAEVNPLLLGQLETGLDKVEITAYVSMMLTGTFELDPETREISFVLSGDPEIYVQIVDYVLTDKSIDLEELIGRFASRLLEKYITDVIKSVELPAFPIGAEVEGVPDNLTWVLDNGELDRADGYFRIIGEVGVEQE